MSSQNTQKDIQAQCQIVWFPWTTEFPGDAANPDYGVLSDSKVFDISAHLTQSCVFTKNRGAPAGHFNFKLDNSRDWKSVMRPGQWCTIYLSNSGDLKLPTQSAGGSGTKGLPEVNKHALVKKRLRAICYIERVAVNTLASDGVVDVVYEVSGRDYGVVYEETSVWFNYFQFEQLQVTGLSDKVQYANSRTIKELLDVTHDLFYAPQRVIPGKTDPAELFAEVGVQWLLPKKMVSLLGLKLEGQYSFYGNLANLKKFSKTVSTISITDPLSYINGNAWEKLKQFSVKELHELFVELNDAGEPNLVFRPIPWAIDKRGYKELAGKLDPTLFYLKLSESGVPIKNIEILSSSLGEDNHNRYNHFLVTSQATFGLPQSNISILKGQKSDQGREYPNLQKGSIRRHGFRPMHVDVDTLGQFTNTLDVDNRILLEVNELIYDYWNNAIYFESGSFTIIGRNDVRVGKTLNLDADVSYHGGKICYIEEYVDEFTIDENKVTGWTQALTVSRCIEKADLIALSGFSKRQKAFKDTGDFVKD